MEGIHPYLKYIVYLCAVFGVLWVNRIMITDKNLRAWIMQSFEETDTANGGVKRKASGKALSAFAVTISLILGWLIAIHFSANHIAPEYYFWGLLSYSGGLYGIKEFGKAINTKYTAPFINNGNGNNISTQSIEKSSIVYDDATMDEWKLDTSDLKFSEWYKQNKNNPEV